MTPNEATDLIEETKSRAVQIVRALDARFATSTGAVNLLAMSQSADPAHFRVYIEASRLLRSMKRLEITGSTTT